MEPSRPREEYFQPLIASIPPILQSKHGDPGPEAINGRERLIVATEIPKDNQDGTTKNLSNSSSSSSRDKGCCSTEKVETNHASVGSKRVRSPLSSSLSSVSSTSVSSPPSSDEDRIHVLGNSRISLQAPKPSRLIDPWTTRKRHQNSPKKHTSTSPQRLTKASPAKRVRFVMDKQEIITPNHGAGSKLSSRSSNESYTDPPSPSEPYDACDGYHRTPAASKSYHTNGQIDGWRIQIPAGVETEMEKYDGFLDSEDGSEIDVQALSVKRRPQRTVQADVTGLTSDQRPHQSNTKPAARSKQSGTVIDRSCVVTENDESNVGIGLRLKESHAKQIQHVSPPQPREQLRYPQLRSGKDLPEPIFVVRPSFPLDAKEKGKPAGGLSNGGYSSNISRNGHEGRKVPPSYSTPVKAPSKNKPPNCRPPSVTDDLKRDVELDEGLNI